MRLRGLKNTVILLFFLLFINIFQLQIIKGAKYFKQSENNCIRLVSEEASRGIIYDCNQIALVKNELVFDLVVIPQEISAKNRNSLFLNLSKFVDISPQILEQTFNLNFDSSFSPVMLVAGLSREVAFAIEQEMPQLPGAFIKTRARRRYIYGEASAHVLGYVGKMRESEYLELKKYGYLINDLVGRSGLEKSYDHRLRGKPGGMQLEVNNAGRIIKVLSYKPPAPGGDLHTTIDIKLQLLIHELAGEKKGAVCVMDADSGEVLALYSAPSYDPNILVDKKRYLEIANILKKENAPLLNRNLRMYAPGSIFKIVTAYAGLAEKKIGLATTFECTGKLEIGKQSKKCWLERGHGILAIENAITTSCNVFFYKLGLRTGQQSLARYAREFGLGNYTKIDIPEGAVGIVPDAKWVKTKFNKKWYAGDTLNFAIGQGYLLISPLQALKMVALVANEGYEVWPHLAKTKQANVRSNKKILSTQILRIIQAGMRKVVRAAYGTGHRVDVDGMKIFAKTGTAQVAGRRAHAWFVGYTELEERTICFAIFLEHGGHGGQAAADIGKQIVLYLHKWRKNA